MVIVMRQYSIVGINHRKANVSVRERFSVAMSQAEEVVRACTAYEPQGEWCVISTCNRTELWCHGVSVERQYQWLAQYFGFSVLDIQSLSEHYDGLNAYRHAVSVASGMDSMVVGEPQILGQIKAWYQVCKEHQGVRGALDEFCQQVLFAAKRIRHQTAIGQHATSMANIISRLIEAIHPHWSGLSLLWVGAGDMVQDLMPCMATKGFSSMWLANRSLSRAEQWVDPKLCQLIHFQELSDYLSQADVVISATASLLPIMGKGVVERIMKGRRMRPLIMIDLAVPRDIEPEVKEVDGVFLYDMDGLQQLIEQGAQKRKLALDDAEQLLHQAAQSWQKEVSIARHGSLFADIEACMSQSLAEMTASLTLDKAQEPMLRKQHNQIKHQIMAMTKQYLAHLEEHGEINEIISR